MARIILHVDMDAFFTSCEERKDPSLKGKPVVVGADPKEGKGRGVCSTANYVARRFGIGSAMPVSKAYRLCPKAIFLRGDFSFYREISKNVMGILFQYSTRFSQVSVDEAYLDITDVVADLKEARTLGEQIKKDILTQEKITCSVGIGPNKLIAKTCSDFQKPDGLTVVSDEEKEEFLAPLPIRKLRGIGPKTEQKIKTMGINTIGELAAYSKEKLIGRFGVYGSYLHLAARGIGSDIIGQHHDRVSLGHERTYFTDTKDMDTINDTISSLAELIEKRLMKESLWCKTISIKVRLEDFSTFTRAKTLSCPFFQKQQMIDIATELFSEFKGKKIRLIGLRATNLEQRKEQKTLVDYSG